MGVTDGAAPLWRSPAAATGLTSQSAAPLSANVHLPGSWPAAAPQVPPPDFYILAMMWPPALLPAAAQSRAKHLEVWQQARAGFWTHGLWPASSDQKITERCTTQVLDLSLLAGFDRALRFYLRTDVASGNTADVTFWSHEWERHGTCSGTDPLGYFLAVYHASALVDVGATLRRAGLLPSNMRPYELQQYTAVLAAAYGVGFNSHIGLKCDTDEEGRLVLSEVRLCLSPSDYTPYDCSAYAQWLRPETKPWLDTCGANASAPVWFLEFVNDAAVPGVPWVVLGVVGGVVAAVMVALAGGYLLLVRQGKVPRLFRTADVRVVHYGLVHKPVEVLCEPVDMAWLWGTVPAIAEFVDDLPVGMGIKGGIARKLLKERYGTPEPPGTYDIDVLVFIDEYTVDDRKAAREVVTGMRLGGLVLEAKDVEVLSKAWLTEYFTSRDVTMNEVLILKRGPGDAIFFYTQDAVRDVRLQLIRPSCHALKSEFNLNWCVDEDGLPYVSPSQVCRCLVRYLKHHGTDYAFDETTWAYYRRVKLNKIQLFKVLRPFHDDDQAMQEAVDHLIEIGFLARSELRRAGGVNLLWGLLLQEVNATVASHSGGRMTLGEQDADQVEAWVDSKKAQVASKLIANEMRARRTGFIPADEGVVEMGLLRLPPELDEYIASGPTFDAAGQFEEAAEKALTRLRNEAAGAAGGVQPSPKTDRAPPRKATSPVPPAAPVRPEGGEGGQWRMQRSVAADASDAVLHATRDGALDGSPHLKRLLSSEAATEKLEKLRSALLAPNEGDPRHMQELQGLVQEARERGNTAFRRVASPGPSTASASGSAPPPLQPPLPPPADAQDGASDSSEGAMADPWLTFSEYGRWTGDVEAEQLGSFYQNPNPPGAWVDEYTPLIKEDETPQRRRPPLLRLAGFCLSVVQLDWRLLLAAHSVLLLSLMFRLALPRVLGAIVDSFSDLDMTLFRGNLVLAARLVAADVTLSLGGRLLLEVFARRTMTQLLRRLFEHVLYQELSFFTLLTPGELMARTSGDSLTLRSMLTTSAYQWVEGAAMFVGATLLVVFGTGGVLLRAPAIVGALLLGLLLAGVEAFGVGLAARRLNLLVRQALGRMFGFTLSAFTQMDTVASLSLEERLTADYRLLGQDYFRFTFYQNTLQLCHKAFTTALSAVLRIAVLWFGGRALFNDLVTVGGVLAMLSYVTMMEKGIKQSSDAWARIMASFGSLERVVELHDRGVLRNAATLLPELVPAPTPHSDGASKDAGAGDGLTEPLLPHPTTLMVAVPPERRPDFGAMTGGVRLQHVHLSLRLKTDSLVLQDASLELKTGEAAIVTGASGQGKSSLLQLVFLRLMPYQGYLALELPEAAAGGPLALHTARGAPLTAAAAGGGGLEGTAGAASLVYGSAPAGAGSVWAQFSFLKDDVTAARRRMALVSVATTGLFRGSVEDNVACATMRPLTYHDVRQACERVGLAAKIMALPDGYRTVIGEGSGVPWGRHMQLRLALARALVRRPRLLLLDDADQFAEALGEGHLAELLQELHSGGTTLLVAAARPERLPFIKRVYRLQQGHLYPQEPPPPAPPPAPVPQRRGLFGR